MVGTIYPAVRRRWPIFWARYTASRSFLMSFFRAVEAIHLPPAPDPDIFGEPWLVENMSSRVLGLKQKGMDEQKQKAWVERKRPFLFIKTMKLCTSPLA